MVQMVMAHKLRASLVVLKHSAHIQNDDSSQRSFPIPSSECKGHKVPQALKNPFEAALVIRVSPCRKAFFVVFLVHPVQGWGVQCNMRHVKPNIIRKNVTHGGGQHFAFKQMGAGRSRESDANRFRVSSSPRGLHVEGDRAFLDMPDGSRRLIAVRGGGRLMAGDSPVQVEPPIPREAFETMWNRMLVDTPDEYAVPLPDEAYEIVEAYYDSHPTAQYDSVRGYAVSLLPRYADALPRALRLLLFETRIGFMEYETELANYTALLAAAGRPEPFAVFPAEAYAKWEGFLATAAEIQESYAARGIQLPPL